MPPSASAPRTALQRRRPWLLWLPLLLASPAPAAAAAAALESQPSDHFDNSEASSAEAPDPRLAPSGLKVRRASSAEGAPEVEAPARLYDPLALANATKLSLQRLLPSQLVDDALGMLVYPDLLGGFVGAWRTEESPFPRPPFMEPGTRALRFQLYVPADGDVVAGSPFLYCTSTTELDEEAGDEVMSLSTTMLLHVSYGSRGVSLRGQGMCPFVNSILDPMPVCRYSFRRRGRKMYVRMYFMEAEHTHRKSMELLPDVG